MLCLLKLFNLKYLWEGNSMIKKMSLAWITVADLAKSKKFFTETLGLEISSSAEEWGWLELKGKENGMLLGVAQENKEHSEDKPGANAVVTMTVDNLEKSMAELKKKGVAFVGEVMEVAGHVKMVTFKDNDGNTFQLVEELS